MTETDAETLIRAKPPGPTSRLGIWVLAATLAVDQATKWIADASLELNMPADILPILALHLTYNPGIAFSFFTGANSSVLLAAVVVVTLVVLVLWARASEGGRLATVGFALIVGGALGNIVDRLIYGHVIDFLRLHVEDRDLFVFNLADFALTLGPIILVAAFIWGPRPKRPE
ncbi:MAG: signal peptidase II [Alphaproteobacteria bacterium]